MLALAHSAAMLGIDGFVVRVEADSAPGTPGFAIIGLPDSALREARDRVRAAVINSGYQFPAGRVLVNLAPADIRKVGPGFDLPIALALLAIDEQLARYVVEKGSIAIDGVSLTVAAVDGSTVTIALIPQTCVSTTLGDAEVGRRVNVEVDILAKHLERLVTR